MNEILTLNLILVQSLAVYPKSLASVKPKSASPPNDQDLTSKVAEKIYVGHLASHVQKRDLEDLFGYYGPLLSVEVKHGGFAFVHFQSQQDAQDAVAALHNFMFDGRSLTVEFSLKKGNTASNGCLVCGKEGHWARFVMIIILLIFTLIFILTISCVSILYSQYHVSQ
jgi:hypothetical protein